MTRAQRKKVQEIANFIVNNITLAEITTIAVKQSQEYAEYIVKYNLDPKNFNSEVSRKRLFERIQKAKKTERSNRVVGKQRPFHEIAKSQISKPKTPKKSNLKKFLEWAGFAEPSEKKEEKKFKTKR